MHHHHRACAGGHRFVQRGKIDLPSVIVNQRVRCQGHILKVGEKLKQWIARLGHQDFIAGIAQQPENVGIPLARARGKHQRLRIDLQVMLLAVIGGDCLARAGQPLGLRIVIRRLRPAK